MTESENPSWVHVNTIDEMQAFFMSRLPAIREAAKACGYAIGFHGSARRDFDLMAMPWGEVYSTPNALAEEIQKAACGFHHAEYKWEKKPSGRIATAFPICWTGDMPKMLSLGHVDLSVMIRGSIETPLDLMTCGKLNHFWRADKFDPADCPCCQAQKLVEALKGLLDDRFWDDKYGKQQPDCAAWAKARDALSGFQRKNNG